MSYGGAGARNYGQPGPYASGYAYPAGTSGAGAWGMTNWTQTSQPVMSGSGGGMGSANVWAAAIQAVGDYFNTRAEVKAAQATQKRNLAAERYFTDMKRRQALEDKRYLEEGGAIYRQLARPNLQAEPPPVMTNPNVIVPVNPYNARRRG